MGDGDALDQLHDEVRPARCGGEWCVAGGGSDSLIFLFARHAPPATRHLSRRSAVEHLGDIGVVHHREGLAFGFEAGDHLPRVHARLQDLERDLATDGLGHSWRSPIVLYFSMPRWRRKPAKEGSLSGGNRADSGAFLPAPALLGARRLTPASTPATRPWPRC